MTAETKHLPAQVTSDILEDIAQLDVETVLAILTGDVEIIETDTSQVSKEIMRTILEAETIEDVLSVNPGTKPSDDLLNVPLRFLDFRLMPSRFEDTTVYMAVECVYNATGEKFVLSTSSANVMAQIARAKWLGKMPFVAQIKRAEKATAAGYYPLRLADVMEGK